MSRYRYNRQISPPAPFAYAPVGAAVEGCPPRKGRLSSTPLRDLSVVPRRIVEELRLDPLGEFEVLGLSGHLMTLPTYLVRIQLRGLAPQIVEVVASPEEPYILLGRDVLNRFRVMLDGPNMVLEIE